LGPEAFRERASEQPAAGEPVLTLHLAEAVPADDPATPRPAVALAA